MKKLLLLLLLVPMVSFAQVQVQGAVPTYANPYPQPIQVEVQPNANPFANPANKTTVINRATPAVVPLSEASTNITIDQLKGSSNQYKYLAIKRVSGWAVSGNFVTIINQVNSAKKYSIVSLNNLRMRKVVNNSAVATSDDKKSRKQIKRIDEQNFYEPVIPQEYLNDSETLFLEWTREALAENNRFSRLVLKNSNGEVIYNAEYNNVGYSEMLRPVTTDFTFNKEDAKKKLMELKEYLDMGIITQEEFNNKAVSLKKILLGN